MIPFTALDLAVQRTVPRAATFADFMRICGRGYHPTLRQQLTSTTDRDLLADAFDARRAMEGRPERAYRC